MWLIDKLKWKNEEKSAYKVASSEITKYFPRQEEREKFQKPTQKKWPSWRLFHPILHNS